MVLFYVCKAAFPMLSWIEKTDLVKQNNTKITYKIIILYTDHR